MLTSKMVRFSAVALVGFACMLATEARAQLAPALTAPLSCTVPLGSGTLTIQAGADNPRDVTSLTASSCPANTTCSEYTYIYNWTGGALSHSALSVSADLNIYAANPSASIEGPTSCSGDTSSKVGTNVCEQRQIRFNQNSSTINASVIVTRAAPRITTAGAVKGTASAYCLIQGPGVAGGTIAPVSFASTLLVAHGHCPVDVTTGPDGGFTSVENSAGSTCTKTLLNVAPNINNQPVQIPPGRFVTYGTDSCGLTLINGKYYNICR